MLCCILFFLCKSDTLVLHGAKEGGARGEIGLYDSCDQELREFEDYVWRAEERDRRYWRVKKSAWVWDGRGDGAFDEEKVISLRNLL
jgi:hypothetical protein